MMQFSKNEIKELATEHEISIDEAKNLAKFTVINESTYSQLRQTHAEIPDMVDTFKEHCFKLSSLIFYQVNNIYQDAIYTIENSNDEKVIAGAIEIRDWYKLDFFSLATELLHQNQEDFFDD